MSEFIADRTGRLCSQNPKAAIRANMKMASVPIKENEVSTQFGASPFKRALFSALKPSCVKD